jgi:F-type H+-transporting ATPase subunit a
LALFTFVITNVTGSKVYWKDIFWPDVPIWLKIPPIIPFIEFVSILTKPFALMVRLFGNMMAGHMGMLVLTSLTFITVSISPVLCGSMTIIAVLFNIFMLLLEVLIAFLQAYIFTMLSATFIGMSQEGKKELEVAK